MFRDPLHRVIADRVVDGEQRWQALGLAWKGLESLVVLLVAHTIREDIEHDTLIEVVRIVSARKASPEERKSYENKNG